MAETIDPDGQTLTFSPGSQTTASDADRINAQAGELSWPPACAGIQNRASV